MTFANAILKNAKKWTDCVETAPNRSTCVDKIHKYTSGTIDNDPYCAEFVWMIADKTAKSFGIDNILPRTASTVTMVTGAKKNGLKVNSTPKAGSIFFYPRSGGKGHVGFVAEVKGKNIATIEGNNGDRIGWNDRTIGSDYKFIHIENMAGSKKILAGGTLLTGILLLSAGIGYYYAKRKGII